MKINVEKLGVELRHILDEDGLSVTELAGVSGVAPETLYSILDGTRASTQRATIRKIADTTNRDFHISGDEVTFTKKADAGKKILTDFEVFWEKYQKLSPEKKRQLTKIMEVLGENGEVTEAEPSKN